jgi:hypothetical protein
MVANRPDAPGAVMKDFGEAVALVAAQPGIGARHTGARARGVRRLYLGRVRYFVYYSPTSTELRVLAFWHASREHPPAL